MHIFDISNIAFTVLGYPISYIELIGISFGLISVYYATKANILTWSTGIVNEVFFCLLFFQIHLYADMFLQLYFFVVTIYGWYNWNKKVQKRFISNMNIYQRSIAAVSIIVLTIVSGFIFKNIHSFLPQYFAVPASYPFTDSLVMVASIVATMLLAKKYIENWHLWVIVDAICVVLYYQKGVYFLAIEYFLFLCLALFGLYNWKLQLRND